MRYFEDGMGLFGWRSDEVIIHGGMSDGGLHKPDAARLRFVAYDASLARTGDWDRAKLADIVMSIRPGQPPTINGLIDLKLPVALRRQGHGSRIVDILVEASGGRLRIHDIKGSAVGFWRKVGIGFGTPADARPAKGTTIEGVIDRREPEPDLEPEPDQAPGCGP